jgi:hypothetical protein
LAVQGRGEGDDDRQERLPQVLLVVELHRGQQFSGARVAGGEIHRGERPVVDVQGETVAAEP